MVELQELCLIFFWYYFLYFANLFDDVDVVVILQRVVQERDELKEHVEDLRCLKSAQSPSHRSDKPHSDLLASDPQELWSVLYSVSSSLFMAT